MGELAVLLAALAVGLACRIIPAQLPYVFPFVFNPLEFLGCWLVALWYWRGLRRAPVRPSRLRQAFFLAGLAGIYFVLQTHFEYVSQHMFFLNRVQAVTLGMAAPFGIAIGWMGEVLALGAPGWVVRAAAAAWARLRWLSHPVPATLIFLTSTDLWLIPPVHFAAMLNPRLYAVMNISCLLGGLLFWLMVLDPRPKPPARFGYLTRAATGFLVMFPQIAVSAYIALSTVDLYPFYTLCGRLIPSISATNDQMLGGLIQWIPPGMMNTAALVIGLNSLRLAEAEADKHFVPPPGAKIYEAKWTGR
ncbi:cytochrome c oxidase assembly protein [Acidocella sp. KAb 2-4]|uniref:cytochrome c oxidase assembly protein n=1 Tax=Acidocella sp. KAb 2-4 TaxID=2885158 RepID=UPI001D06048D|nr:cytochrome c oxidase assembly protein [Acidocella sp. KAb 2-4]MCB5944777.1 cytochrome c oxidase assembly protein [Acidocella sp. KAb 2-4]